MTKSTDLAERDELIEHYASEATKILYRYKGLRAAMQAKADSLCDCGSISGCHDTMTREALLSILADDEARR